MTRDEAKFILTAYRPDGRDAADPAFVEAVKLSSVDPDLAVWFERSRAQDAGVAARLAEIGPPRGLREAILAGARMEQTKRSPWRKPLGMLLAAAAALAVAFGASLWRRPALAGVDPQALAQFAFDDLEHGHHGGAGAPTFDYSRRLGAVQTSFTSAVPADFERLRATGCRTLHFAGRDVLEVCFARGGSEFHLYVLPRGTGAGGKATAQPSFFAQAADAAAVWSDGRFDYAVVGKVSLAAVRGLF